MKVIFDLDGTIALIDHRRHLAKEHWPSFERSCVTDQPNLPVIAIMKELRAAGWHIEIWSGRSEKVRDYTEDWLLNNNVRYNVLRMRPIRNSIADEILKEKWLLAETIRPAIVFDDRQKVVDMWRRNGIVCCQVAPGDF